MKESEQIGLIEAEYISRGYEVFREVTLRQFDLPLDFTADLVARRPDDAIIVEIANTSHKNLDLFREKIEALKSVLRDNKEWRIEFRFLDISALQEQSRNYEVDLRDVKRRLARYRIPIAPVDAWQSRFPTAALHNAWLWIRGIRTLAHNQQNFDPTDDIPDLVADFFNAGILRPHLTTPYSELHDAISRTLEGDEFPNHLLEVLAWHVQDLRRVVNQILKRQIID